MFLSRMAAAHTCWPNIQQLSNILSARGKASRGGCVTLCLLKQQHNATASSAMQYDLNYKYYLDYKTYLYYKY